MKYCLLMLLPALLIAGCSKKRAGGRELSDWVQVLKTSSDPAELKQAADAVGSLGPDAKNAASHIMVMLGNDIAASRGLSEQQMTELRAALRDALRKIGPDVAEDVVRMLASRPQIPPDIAQSLDPAGVPILVKALAEHPKLPTRVAIARFLGDMRQNATAATPALLEAAKTPGPDHSPLRAAAISALSHIHGDAKTIGPSLIQALDDPDPVVRVAAIEGLSRVRADASQVGPRLIRKLENDPSVAKISAQTLATYGRDASSAAPALLGYLRRASTPPLAPRNPHQPPPKPTLDNEDSLAALNALHRLGQFSQIDPPLLAQIMEHRIPDLAAEATKTLIALGPQASSALPALINQIGTGSAIHLRPRRQEVFVAIGKPAVAPLMSLLDHGTVDEHSGAMDTGENVRRETVNILAALGPQAAQALPKLKEMTTEDTYRSVREAAAAAVHKIEPQ